LVCRGEVEVGIEEDSGVGFDVEEVMVDEEGSSWAMTVKAVEVKVRTQRP
jgi:hypothetical protein